MAGATATRGYSGFGWHQTLHTPKIEVLAEHLPIRIEFVDTPEKVEEVLPALCEMLIDGMIEVQDTTVVKAGSPGGRSGTERDRPCNPSKQAVLPLAQAHSRSTGGNACYDVAET